MPVIYNGDYPFGFDGTIAQATGSSETTILLQQTPNLDPAINADPNNYVYAILRHKDSGPRELIRINSFDETANTVTVTRGIDGTPLTLLQGDNIYVSNDRKTMVEAFEAHAATVDPQDVATIEAAVQRRIDAGLNDDIDNRVKVWARANNTARVPANELQEFDELDSLDELHAADKFVAEDSQDRNEKKKVTVGLLSSHVEDQIGLPQPSQDKAGQFVVLTGDGYASTSEVPQPSQSTLNVGEGLSGDGSQTPLSVTNPFTQMDEDKLDGIERGAQVNPNAAEVRDLLAALTGNARLQARHIRLIATGFNGNLANTDDDLQKLAQKVDDLVITGGGGGGGTDDQTASEVNTDVTNFSGILNSDDDTVQKALDKIDDIPLLTESQVIGIIRRLNTPVDDIATFDDLTGSVTDTPGASQTESRIGAGTFTDNLGTFTVDGTTFTLRQVYSAIADQIVSVVLSANNGNNLTNANKLQHYSFTINNDRFAFADAEIVTDASWINWSWRNLSLSADPITRDSQNKVVISEPLGKENYVPGDGNADQVLGSDGDNPQWRGLQAPIVINSQGNVAIETALERTTLTDNDRFFMYRISDDSIYRISKRTAKAFLEVGHEIATGTEFPADPEIGDRIIIVSPTTQPRDHYLPVTQASADIRQINLGHVTNGPSSINAYASHYSGPQAALLRDRVAIVTNGAPTKTMDKLVFHSDRYRPVEYTISRSAVANLPHTFLTTDRNYGDFILDESFYVNIIFTDGTKLFPDQAYTVGDYIFDGTKFIFTPGVAADWATQGRPEPRTLLSVETLDSTNIGLATTNSSQARYGTFQAFTRHDGTNFDVDENPTGIVETQINATLVTRSDNQIGFSENYNSAVNPSIDRTGFTAISKVTTYESSSDSGFEIFEANIYRGTQIIDKVRFAISKNANPYLGYNLRLSGEAGAYNFNVQVTVNTFIVHNDGPGSTTLLGLIDTPNELTADDVGKALVVNAAHNAFELGEVGGGGSELTRTRIVTDQNLDGGASYDTTVDVPENTLFILFEIVRTQRSGSSFYGATSIILTGKEYADANDNAVLITPDFSRITKLANNKIRVTNRFALGQDDIKVTIDAYSGSLSGGGSGGGGIGETVIFDNQLVGGDLTVDATVAVLNNAIAIFVTTSQGSNTKSYVISGDYFRDRTNGQSINPTDSSAHLNLSKQAGNIIRASEINSVGARIYAVAINPSSGGGSQTLNRTDYSSTFTPSKAATAITTGNTVMVDLAADSIETGHGLTVANNEITIARAGVYHINLSLDIAFETNPPLSNAGGGRIFSVIELMHTPSGGTATVLDDTLLTAYARQPDNHTGTTVGPDQYHAIAGSTFKLGAGDKLQVAIKGEFIQTTDANPGTTTSVKVISADSLMRITSTEISLS